MVRYKNRYYVAEIEVKDQPPHIPMLFNNNQLRNSILRKIQEIHGDFGVGAVLSGYRVKYCNPYTKVVIIRARHGPHKFVGTVLPLIKKIDDTQIQFHILHLGATMVKCFKFIRVIIF